MLGTGIELTIFEDAAGLTHPVRVRDPREWAAALATAERPEPAAARGILAWPCRRCGQQCRAVLESADPFRFARPAVHWCEPAGWRRLAALVSRIGARGYATFPPLPDLSSRAGHDR